MILSLLFCIRSNVMSRFMLSYAKENALAECYDPFNSVRLHLVNVNSAPIKFNSSRFDH